ncbi:MAG: hypothetical protein ACYDG6_15000 [Thermincolia bacterium]
MKPSDAVEWIKRTFDDPKRLEELASSIPEEQFLEVLDSIKWRLPFRSGSAAKSVSMFLYCGCLKFDRWVTPTPYVLVPSNRERLRRFVEALCQSEEDNMNSARFIADQIKSDIFSLLDRQPFSKVHEIPLGEMVERLQNTKVPNNHLKKAEFNQIADECLNIISSAEKGTLTTRIQTRLPVTPVTGPCVINTVWNGIQIKVFFRPVFSNPPNSFVEYGGGVAIPLASSQWQNGYCEVIIELSALDDFAAGREALAGNPSIEGAFTEWPGIFVDTFDILDSVIWKLRESQQTQGKWILLPSDIAEIKWELTADTITLGPIIKGPPGVVKVTSPVIDTQELSIDIYPPTKWHMRCRILAENYISTGETNEALFWLNVGTEALFEERVNEICNKFFIDPQSLSSSKSYWERAKDVVTAQFPELANKIEWPEAALGVPSWFTRIRYLGKLVDLRYNASEVLKRYSEVNKYRNTLFHGVREGKISMEDTKKALESFIWLEDNFYANPDME